jgi:twinkle protein
MDNERFIEWENITVKGSENGVKKTTCPSCSHGRKKKNDPCLYVNFESGVAKCFNCERLSFRESDQPTERTYTLPPQEWINFTTLSDKLVQWIWKERNISQTTLNKFEVSEEKAYFPQRQKEMNSICFNYFEGSKCVNKKFRSSLKDFTQSKGGKPILYNLNTLIGLKSAYVVEGEFDVLAMYEHGIKNVVSLPNGANDNDDYWINSEPYLKDIEKFIIAVDNDEKGNAIKERIAQRLGRYRCTFIEWDGKDANDDLKSGKIAESLANEKRFSIGGTFTSDDLLDDILKLHETGLPPTIKPTNEVFSEMNSIFSVMRGQLTTGTGIPSHGKSTFTDWYTLNLVADHNMKMSIFSPEHNPMELYKSNLIQKAVGKPFFADVDGVKKITVEDIHRYNAWAKEKIYLTSGGSGETVDWDWLLEKFKEQMFAYGVDIFVVDAWNKVQMPKGLGGKDGIDTILTRLTAFCVQNNVIMFLIAHPTKMSLDDKTGIYKVPTLYDVSGSADFYNQTHNGFTIYRVYDTDESEGFTSFTNRKTKYSFQGTINDTVQFKFHRPSGRYYKLGMTPTAFDLTEPREQIELINSIQPNTEFDGEIDDCPF